ncbi:MAG: hypothetical protein ACRCVL_00830, partial [Cetobacterium sp.]
VVVCNSFRSAVGVESLAMLNVSGVEHFTFTAASALASKRSDIRPWCMMGLPEKVKKPLCFHSVPKSWTTPNAYVLSV